MSEHILHITKDSIICGESQDDYKPTLRDMFILKLEYKINNLGNQNLR